MQSPATGSGSLTDSLFSWFSEASLADLNGRLGEPLPMDRFRPNLVIRGATPSLRTGGAVRIGSITFRVLKPCARCAITSVDQASAVTGKEPLRMLAGYRKVGGKVLFGQNLVHDETVILSVGDALQVVNVRE